MANDKRFVAKNGLRTQNIEHVSPDRSSSITATMLDSDTLSFDGDSGQLFSLTDTLTGTIFSVNDITGIPSIEVDDDGTIRFAEFAGNVLIGTDTDNGEDKLQVNGSISGDGSNITKISVPTSDSPPSNPKDGELWWDSDEGNMFVYYSDGSSEQWVPSSIGYPGPQGPQGPRGYTGSSSTTLDISNDTSTDPLFPVMVTGTGGGRDGRVNTSDLAFDSNNGRLGIGTASPNSTLDVNGDARFSGNTQINGNIILPSGNNWIGYSTSQSDPNIEFEASGLEITGGGVKIGGTGPPSNGNLEVTSSITCGSLTAGSITETSTIAVKENIKPIENAVELLSAVSAYTFDRTDNGKQNQSGVIAEELFEIMPDLVACDEHNKPMGVHYTNLIGYLIAGIKELKQELDELKSK